MVLLTLEQPVELHGVVVMKHVISTSLGAIHCQPQETRMFLILLTAYPYGVDHKRLTDLVTETGNENIVSVRLAHMRPLLEPLGIKIIRKTNLVAIDLSGVPK